MSQVTTATLGNNLLTQIKIGAGTYVDLTGQYESVDPVDAKIILAEVYTPGINTPLLVPGDLSSCKIKINVVFTEGATEAWRLLEAAFVAQDKVQVKWQPNGATGGTMESVAGGYVSTMPYSTGKGGDSKVLMAAVEITVPGIKAYDPA